MFGLILIALLDRAWLLSEACRPWLSVLLYAGTVTSLAAYMWRQSLSVLSHTAQEAEQMVPQLKGKLLSAVELSQEDASAVVDSVEFRHVLQEQVAEQVSRIHWPSLMPLKQLLPKLRLLLWPFLLCICLSFVTRLHFPGFLLRAALPFANLARPSSVQISILEPVLVDQQVPAQSEVDIRAQIAGKSLDRALLEYRSASAEQPSKLELRPTIDQQDYQVALHVESEPISYRVLASDGVSSWRTLTPRPRPAVEKYDITIQPPSYLNAKPIVQQGQEGHLAAVQGSSADLQVHCTEAIATARLVLNPDAATHPSAPDVKIVESKRLQFTLPIDGKSDAWALELVSAETGFTSASNMSWNIQTQTDLPPIVNLSRPTAESFEALAQENLSLEAQISDDTGLKQVVLSYSINAQPAQEVALPLLLPANEAEIKYSWALSALKLAAGDSIIAQIIARDLKMQEAKSQELRILIIEESLDQQHKQWALDELHLAHTAEKLTSLAEQLRHLSHKGNKEQLAKAELSQLREQTDQLWEQLKQVTSSAPTLSDANDMKLLGDKLAQIRHEVVTQLEHSTLTADKKESKQARQHISKLVQIADEIKDAVQAFAREDMVEVSAQVAHQRTKQVAQLVQNTLPLNRDPHQRTAWQAQAQALIHSQQNLEEELQQLGQAYDASKTRHLRDLQKRLHELAAELGDSLDASNADKIKSPEYLYSKVESLRQRTQQTTEELFSMAEDAQWKALEQRKRNAERPNPALVLMKTAQQTFEEQEQAVRDPQRFQREVHNALSQAANQLQDQAELCQQSPMLSTPFATDKNRASRAIQGLTEQLLAKPDHAAELKAKVEALSQITHTLATAEQLNVAKDAIQSSELNQASASSSKVEQTLQDIDSLELGQHLFQKLPEQLQAMPLDPQIKQTAWETIQPLHDASENLRHQLRHMFQNNSSPSSSERERATQQLQKVQVNAAAITSALQPIVDAARQQLAPLTPQVSDMMRASAEQLKQAQQQSLAAKEEALQNKSTTEEVAQSANLLAQQHEQERQQRQSLQAALMTEANAAQLSEEAQRQLARTADVAMEQLRQQEPQISSALQQAVNAKDSTTQAQALEQAAQAQGAGSQTLQQLANNLAQIEAGKTLSEQELAAMKNVEQQLGVQAPLDNAYDEAEMLAQAKEKAQTRADEALRELEALLQKSPTMQKALAQLGNQTAANTQESFTAQADQLTLLSSAAEDAAHELQRVARHQERLQQKEHAAQTQTASAALSATAEATKTDLSQASKERIQSAKQAADSAKQSAAQTEANSPDIRQATAHQVAQGQQLAEALDDLDKMANASKNPNAPDSSNIDPSAAKDSAQNAQQSLDKAQQSQQQSMAQARAQGQVPGQSSEAANRQQQQTALAQQAGKSQSSSTSQANMATSTAASANAILQDMPVVVIEDWGSLPNKIAKDLTEATRQEAPAEYRTAIENYYKALATQAQKK